MGAATEGARPAPAFLFAAVLCVDRRGVDRWTGWRGAARDRTVREFAGCGAARDRTRVRRFATGRLGSANTRPPRCLHWRCKSI